MTSSQLATLKIELQTDPNTYGYAAFLPPNPAQWQQAANLLNERRSTIRMKRDDVQPSEIFHAIAVADLVNNPGASQLEWFNALLHGLFPIRLLNDDGTDTPVRVNVLGLVRSGTTTLTRLAALQDRDGSRAEQLFGRNVVVTDVDVEAAWKLP